MIGTGSIGLLMVQLFKKQGVAVIGLDQQPVRLKLAHDLGADEVVDVRLVDPVEKVRAWAGGRGVDAVVDAVGHPEVVKQAIRMGAPGSTVVLFGVPAGDETIPVLHQALIMRGQRLTGCTGTPFLFPRALELLSRREVCVEPLITHRCGLGSLSRAMIILEQRAEGAIKVLIQPFRQG